MIFSSIQNSVFHDACAGGVGCHDEFIPDKLKLNKYMQKYWWDYSWGGEAFGNGTWIELMSMIELLWDSYIQWSLLLVNSFYFLFRLFTVINFSKICLTFVLIKYLLRC